MGKLIDETGNKYGDLTVIKRAGSKHGEASWLCKCECGKETIVTGYALRSGNTTSCGCKAVKCMRIIGKANAIDITGKKFGKLTAINPIGSSTYGGVLWQCKCDCGNLHEVEYNNLITGKVKSCGCLTSAGEALIQNILDNYKIKYKVQYTPENWKLSTGYKPFFDFALFNNFNELLCLLEYNGEQHKHYYSNKNTWNNKENFIKTKRRDNEKIGLCKSNNVNLEVIWYDDDINVVLLKIIKKYYEI